MNRSPADDTSGEGEQKHDPELDDTQSEDEPGSIHHLTSRQIAEIAAERYASENGPEAMEKLNRDLVAALGKFQFDLSPDLKKTLENYSRTVIPSLDLADSMRPFMPNMSGLAASLAQIQPATNYLKLAVPEDDSDEGPSEGSSEWSDHEIATYSLPESEDTPENHELAKNGAAALFRIERSSADTLQAARQQNENLIELSIRMADQVSAVQRLGNEMQSQTRAVHDQTGKHEAEWKNQANRSNVQSALSTIAVLVAAATLIFTACSDRTVQVELPADFPSEIPTEAQNSTDQ